MQYRCEVTTVEGFVQQIACSYLQHGYRWYVTGVIPSHKDPKKTDAKITRQYEINIPRRTKSRRKHLGYANIHYIRHEHFFVLIATDGHHVFKQAHRGQLLDIRKIPLLFHGYSISHRPGGFLPKEQWKDPRIPEQDHKRRAHVRIRTTVYKELHAHFLELATHRRAESLRREFWNVPFEPYSPVIGQLHKIRRDVNKVRKQAGYELIDKSAIRYKRRIVRPFESADDSAVDSVPAIAAPVGVGELPDALRTPGGAGTAGSLYCSRTPTVR